MPSGNSYQADRCSNRIPLFPKGSNSLVDMREGLGHMRKNIQEGKRRLQSILRIPATQLNAINVEALEDRLLLG